MNYKCPIHSCKYNISKHLIQITWYFILLMIFSYLGFRPLVGSQKITFPCFSIQSKLIEKSFKILISQLELET